MKNKENKKRVYRYKTTSTGSNSHKYGVCEVCGKHASEVFMQSEQREFFSKLTNKIELTYDDCNTHTFGHEECLLKRRR
jgi:hypothetical protein